MTLNEAKVYLATAAEVSECRKILVGWGLQDVIDHPLEGPPDHLIHVADRLHAKLEQGQDRSAVVQNRLDQHSDISSNVGGFARRRYGQN